MFEIGVELLEGLRSPQACVVCWLLSWMVSLIFSFGGRCVELLAGPALILGAAGFVVWLCWTVGRQFLGLSAASGRARWVEIGMGGIRFLVVLLLLGTLNAAGEGPQARSIYEELFAVVVAPLLTVSLGVGMVVLEVPAEAVGGAGPVSRVYQTFSAALDADSARNVGYAATLPGVSLGAAGAPSAVSGARERLIGGVVRLTTGLQMCASAGIARGILYMSNTASWSGVEKWVSIGLGAALVVFFLVFFVSAGVRLADPLVRLAVVVALFPLLAVTALFGSTRSIAYMALRTFGFCVVYFMVAGLMYGLVLAVMVQSFASVALVAGDASAAGGDFERLATLLATAGAGGISNVQVMRLGSGPDAGGFGVPDVLGALMLLFSLFLAHSLVAKVGSIAGALVGYSGGGGIGESTEGQMRSLVFGAGAAGAYTAASAAGGAMAAAVRAVRR